MLGIVGVKIAGHLPPQFLSHKTGRTDRNQQQAVPFRNLKFPAYAACRENATPLQFVTENENGDASMRNHLLPVGFPLSLGIRALRERPQDELIMQALSLMLIQLFQSTRNYLAAYAQAKTIDIDNILPKYEQYYYKVLDAKRIEI